MQELGNTVATEFAEYYRKTAESLHQWVDPLSQEQFWQNPYPYGNSVGHLVLHLTGNLTYYIGTRVAETGYIRDRDREFNEPQELNKQEVLAAFDRAVAMVAATAGKQAPADWMAAYSAEREPESQNRFAIFLRCAAHVYHHAGQIIYLSKELTRQAETQAASR
jgi:uncharacterized damage-inducible protein DinB